MKILLGMSGGLDSCYAALRLKEEGHTVEGAVLLMHQYTDVGSARRAAESIGIPLHVIDATDAFSQVVIPDFINEYCKGRTPNPCIICNSEVKFRILCDFAEENGFDKIATGHYAGVERINTPTGVRFAIKRAVDSKKDQSYMLWRLPQDVLSKLYLPLSDIKKEEIRVIAREKGLFAADAAESQEICFIPSGDYASYIEERVGKSLPGNFVDASGKVVGQHKGIIHYTVGQRKGLGVALGARAFITDINVETNVITLSTEARYGERFFIEDIVFSGIVPPCVGEEISLLAKIRYQASPALARVRFLSDNCAEVVLAQAGKALTDGQSAVFYKDDILAFGGVITTKKQ